MMSDPTMTVDAIQSASNSDPFVSIGLPVGLSFVSVGIAVVFWIMDHKSKEKHQEQIKAIIDGNVKQLATICNRLHVEVDEIESTDVLKAKSLNQYFERNITRLEMIRLNIGNHIISYEKDEKYVKKIESILASEDLILEKCNRPDIPSDNKISLWHGNKQHVKEKTGDIIKIAKDLQIIVT